jgi:hypothetical protein
MFAVAMRFCRATIIARFEACRLRNTAERNAEPHILATIFANGNQFMTRSMLFLGLALLIAVGGVTWWLVASDDGADTANPANIRPAPTGPAAPDGVSTSTLDATASIGDGHTVRILELELDEKVPVDGSVRPAAVVRAEVCAGASDWRGGALPPAFALVFPLRGGGFEYRAGASGLEARSPALSRELAGEVVTAGECLKGWVTIPLDEDDGRRPASLIFDNTAFAFVAQDARGNTAWTF